ncbi:MAG TPA: exodeoxyribonuclease VII small subunit [Clostridiales bacterium]|nr:exodeoxyribonuclease VII small subunit [Clostridiales bacterium]
MSEDKKSLETAFGELEEILAKLEEEDITLEESFALYQEGMRMLKYCDNSIDKVEKQLIVLGEANEEV